MIKITFFLLFSLCFHSILASNQPILEKKGARKIETINNKSGAKTYRENFHAKSFSQLSASVASSQMSCALDCRRVDGCQSFKWTPEDNSCRMGRLVTEFESGEEDSDPVFIEMCECVCLNAFKCPHQVSAVPACHRFKDLNVSSQGSSKH